MADTRNHRQGQGQRQGQNGHGQAQQRNGQSSTPNSNLWQPNNINNQNMTRRGVRPMQGSPQVPLMNQPYSPYKHDNSNRPPGFGQNSYQDRAQYQPSQGSSYTMASQASNQQDQPDSFGDFSDMPTDFFNTANFGTVAIPPLGTGNTNTNGDMGTGNGPSNLTRSMVSDARFTVPGDDADMDRLGDLDLPPDFDDEVDIKDAPITQHHSEGNTDFTTQDAPRERAATQRPSHIKNAGSIVSNAAMQAAEEELRQLKMQLAEVNILSTVSPESIFNIFAHLPNVITFITIRTL